jgi:hypothetical protein
MRLYVLGGIKEPSQGRFESTLANQSLLPRTITLWNEKLPTHNKSKNLVGVKIKFLDDKFALVLNF